MQTLRKGICLPSNHGDAITTLPLPNRVSIALLWGETPLVRVGQRVQLGEKIADGGGDLVPVHASISGTVTAVAPRTCHDGRRYGCVVVERGGENQWAAEITPRAMVDEVADEQLLDMLFESGLRLPGGQPLASVIAEIQEPVQTLLISAIDPEPFLHTENAVILAHSEHVLGGIRLLQRLFRPRRTIIAATAGQSAVMNIIARWAGKHLQICCCADRYPVSQPPLLAAMAAEALPGKSLSSQGIVVLPATSAAGVSRAIYAGQPVVSQVVGVDWGEGRALFETPLGTAVDAVLAATGREPGGPVVLGGPMTGITLPNLTVPVFQGMAGLCLLPQETSAQTRTACIRCGRCASVCPVGLRPYTLESEKRCLHCGACQYSCPAGRTLPLDATRKGREVAYVG